MLVNQVFLLYNRTVSPEERSRRRSKSRIRFGIEIKFSGSEASENIKSKYDIGVYYYSRPGPGHVVSRSGYSKAKVVISNSISISR